ncbi:restriction endonuclease subunit S [Methanolobus sp. ZRKC5]|uniref:restriction endonuclease subunit S n=1 Tax=unclassified Methanolobus TaxID=2629569 RepID=UPI00313AC371
MSAECIAESIPAGYKQTEVGVIPEDWKVQPIGDLVSISVGRDLKEENYSTYQDDIFKYPVFSNTVTNEGLYGFYNISEYNGESLTIVGRGVGLGIAFTRRGSFGAIGRLLVLFPVKNVDANFLTEYINHRVKIFTESGGIPQLTGISIAKYRIPVPSTKDEQEAIAQALTDADALIESLEQLITKKRQIKQGAMQELLTGKKRLPGFSGEWIDFSLRECLLGNPDYGINAPGVPYSGNLPTYLRITDIDDDGRFTPDNQIAVDHPLAMNYLLDKHEIVFARTGASVGKTYLYNIKDGELVFAGFLIRAKINCEKLCPEFFAAFTKTARYWNWVRMMSMRSGQPGINGNEFSGLDLYLPPTIEEQNAIAAILCDMDAELSLLEEKLAKTRKLKQGMMQELLTGRIRLV